MARLTKEAEADTAEFMRRRYAAKEAERQAVARAARAAKKALKRRLHRDEQRGTEPRPRKKNDPLLRPSWYGPDKLMAAFLAGQGRDAAEIAGEIGTTTERLRTMLSKHDIPVTRTQGEYCMAVRWKASDRMMLDREALRLDREPGELAALLIRAVIRRRPELIGEMIDELDVVGV